jgi:hypothetical protein
VKSNHYVLSQLYASFSVPTRKRKNPFLLSTRDIKLSSYLAARMDYGEVIVRPILVERSDAPSVPNIELTGREAVASYRTSLYHVEVLDSAISRASLSDAIHAAMSLLDVAPEEDVLLRCRNAAVGLPVHVEDFSLRERTGYSYAVHKSMWDFATALVATEVLLYASLFVREATRDHRFYAGDVSGMLANHKSYPRIISEAVRIENAVHNCYKAIEAIHGGNLPTDKQKIVRNFGGLGIDLIQPIGYHNAEITREPVIDKIMRLRHSRDWKSAHGRITADRKSTYYELMDFQQLARYIVLEAIRAKTGVTASPP